MKHVKGLRNIFILMMVASLLLSGCGSVATNQTPKSGTSTPAKPISVGYTNFMSGNLAALGKLTDASIRMALDDFNKTAKVPIELNFTDVGSTPVTAKSGFDKLLSTNPKSILAIMSSTQYPAVIQDLDKAHVPLINSATSSYPFEHGFDWVFGVQTTTAQEAGMIPKYWREKLGKSKVVALLPNDDTGKAFMASLQDAAAKNNLTIIPELFQPNNNDYSADITKARRENPDMYYVYSAVAGDLAKVIKQMRQLGIKETIFINSLIGNGDFLNLLTPQELEGIYGHNSSYLDLENPKVQEWAKRFKEKTSFDADPVSQMVYDQAMITFEAAEKTGGDSKKMLDYLHSNSFKGLAGSYKFNSNGLGRHLTNIMQIGPDKKLKRLETISEAGY